jgi:predicted porin
MTSKGGATKVVSGVSGTPRIGLKGSEDLGGGLSASFMVEAGYSNAKEATGLVTTTDGVSTAAIGTNFGDRGASVSLGGGFGTLTLGASVLTPSFFAVAAAEPTGAANYMPAQGAHWGNSRADNSINYSTSIGAVTVRAAVVSKDDNAGQGITDVSAVYSANGLTISAASYMAATQTTVFGAAYDMGAAKLYFLKSNNAKDQSTMGVSAPMGPLTFQAGIYKDNSAGTSTNLVAAVYALSKSTSVNSYYSAPKGSDATLGVGIRHNF